MNAQFGLHLVLVLLCLVHPAHAAELTNAAPAVDIFATNAPVLRIKIEVSKANYRSLQNDSRKDVPATVRAGDMVYTNVAIHVKGAVGSFRPIDDKPALTLNFGKLQKGQAFYGHRKIHLNNSVQDSSYSSEYLCSWLFNEAGVPATRVTTARVWLNNRDLGFFVVKEGFTKEFLARYFKDTKGNLYDGGFLREITDNLEKESGDDRQDSPDLKALASASTFPDRSRRWEQLQKVLDTDRFLSYMALEAITWDWDGYMMKHNNYRVYHDPSTDKIVFFPHGMDQMFSYPNGSVFNPPFGGLVARGLIETPEGYRLYRARVKDVFEKVFQLSSVTNKLEQFYQRNRPAMAELGPGAARYYQESIDGLREALVQRWESISFQLENSAPVDFSKGPMPLKRWRQQSEMGNARLDTPMLETTPTLHIVAQGETTASWRSLVSLEPGRYRFHATARTQRVAALGDERGEGAGIRISGTRSPRRNKVVGDSEWTKIFYDFEIRQPAEITLVCELKARRGEVWFDLNSLQLEKFDK